MNSSNILYKNILFRYFIYSLFIFSIIYYIPQQKLCLIDSIFITMVLLFFIYFFEHFNNKLPVSETPKMVAFKVSLFFFTKNFNSLLIPQRHS